MSPQTLSSALGALRNAGSVFGVVLSQNAEMLFKDGDISAEKITDLVATLDDISFYFEQESRAPDQLAFGYDGANLVILFAEQLRLVVLFHRSEEVDFIAHAARSFLKDYRMSLVASNFTKSDPGESASSGSAIENSVPREDKPHPGTQRIYAQAKKPVSPTQPITPVV